MRFEIKCFTPFPYISMRRWFPILFKIFLYNGFMLRMIETKLQVGFVNLLISSFMDHAVRDDPRLTSVRLVLTLRGKVLRD